MNQCKWAIPHCCENRLLGLTSFNAVSSIGSLFFSFHYQSLIVKEDHLYFRDNRLSNTWRYFSSSFSSCWFQRYVNCAVHKYALLHSPDLHVSSLLIFRMLSVSRSHAGQGQRTVDQGGYLEVYPLPNRFKPAAGVAAFWTCKLQPCHSSVHRMPLKSELQWSRREEINVRTNIFTASDGMDPTSGRCCRITGISRRNESTLIVKTKIIKFVWQVLRCSLQYRADT